MSAGQFQTSKYESTELGGAIMSVRIQPETEGLFINGVGNTPPATDITLSLRASVSNGKREYGVRCRSVTLKWTAAAPDGYFEGGELRVPVLTQAAYLAYTLGSTGTYLGQQVEVIGRSPETAR